MISRRKFNLSATAAAAFLSDPTSAFAKDDPKPEGATGPMVGHVSTTTASVWYRPANEGTYTIQVINGAGKTVATASASSEEKNDRTLTWRLEGLDPNQRYRYALLEPGAKKPIDLGDSCHFTTAPPDHSKSKVVLAIGSCAKMQALPLWKQMGDHGAEGLVLLGDTPYIDSTSLSVQRRKHREFLSVPGLAALVRNTPVWATWDDHDFGKNDSDGRLKGKENARRAFLEYRANDSYGHDKEGIYTSFRRGPVEVILLDTRWFARTEPSPVEPGKPTLLGKHQWEWLRKTLKESTAPFKIVACGMIWDDKKNRESDDWGTYVHERKALFDFIGKEKISGVLLIGGDIHCSRLLRYKTEAQVGYPIYQCIVSPIHNSTISSLNVAHPDLIHGEPIPHVWLRVEVDSTNNPPTLVAQWMQMDKKKMWDLRLTEADLKPKP